MKRGEMLSSLATKTKRRKMNKQQELQAIYNDACEAAHRIATTLLEKSRQTGCMIGLCGRGYIVIDKASKNHPLIKALKLSRLVRNGGIYGSPQKSLIMLYGSGLTGMPGTQDAGIEFAAAEAAAKIFQAHGIVCYANSYAD
jgi:hypothetical protein